MITSATAACRFCEIISGEAPATEVFASETALAFLDRRPLFPGHILVIPRDHYATLSDLPVELIPPFFVTVQLLAKAVETALEAEGTFVAMNNRVSQSIPHLHVHIVPRRKHDGLKGFFWPRLSLDNDDEMARLAERIRHAALNLLPPQVALTKTA